MKYARIYKIEETNEEKEMYDLEVPINQNFILANNILSHNSGKTRALKLITHLAKNGKVQNNMSESVLFRTAENHTLGIDELEHIGSKEKSALRELLNSAYKRGVIVERVYKYKGKEREGYQVEKFNVYCPIVMANIWGMDEVLGDRCLTLVLEKSNNKKITRMMENFEYDDDISRLKQEFSVGSVVSDGKKYINIYTQWNNFVYNYIDISDTTDTTYITNTTDTTDTLFKKIEKTTLDGRHLELFFPLFILAYELDHLDEFIPIAEQIVKEKKEEDVAEGRDVSFLSFIVNYQETDEFIPIRKLTNEFKGDGEELWITPEWLGKSLRRLGIIIEKKRVGKGREVRINFKKAIEKGKMFGIEIKEKKDEIEEIKL